MDEMSDEADEKNSTQGRRPGRPRKKVDKNSSLSHEEEIKELRKIITSQQDEIDNFRSQIKKMQLEIYTSKNEQMDESLRNGEQAQQEEMNGTEIGQERNPKRNEWIEVTKKKNTNKLTHNTTKQNITTNNKNTYNIVTTKNMNRLEFVNEWEKLGTSFNDIIIKTTFGFILKTDENSSSMESLLTAMIKENIIISFKKTQVEKQTNKNITQPSYSVIIKSVDLEISDTEISNQLSKQLIKHRYCKRIISKNTKQPTYLIRIITSCANSFKNLLHKGFFYKHKHFSVIESLPPPAMATPCAKCHKFTHKTENCTTVICMKCHQNHITSTCTSTEQIKCVSCKSTDHQAWSLKCPQHPKKQLDGIPNIKIKIANKLSENIAENITDNSKIHCKLTIHDHIIETYYNKINTSKQINREEVIKQIRRRFQDIYKIDTVVNFIQGNYMYIIMIDMSNLEIESPTEPIFGRQTTFHNND